jgi:hypothetical protein
MRYMRRGAGNDICFYSVFLMSFMFLLSDFCLFPIL